MRTLLTLTLLLATTLVFAKKTEYGLASIYSDEFEDSATAYGETYDPTKMTAAHKSLPFGSIVKITNMDTGKSVMVKINDKGPFIRGYIIEVSGAAAKVLEMKKSGAKVKLVVEKEGKYPMDSELDEDSYTEDESPFAEDTDGAPQDYADNGGSLNQPKPNTGVTTKPDTTPKSVSDNDTKKPAAAASNNGSLAPLKDKGYKVYDLYKASTFIPKASGYGVQVGTYHNLHNVLKETAKLQENWFSNIMLTREVSGKKVTYKVIIGPFEQRSSAQSYKRNAAKKGVTGFVVAVQPTKDLEVYQIKAVRPAKEGYAVQVMNLTDADNVINEVDKLKKKWFKNILINVVKGNSKGEPHYKILLGPFPKRETANSYKENLAKKKMSGFVVDLTGK